MSRIFKYILLVIFSGVLFFSFKQQKVNKRTQPELCITLDDINYLEGPLYSGIKKDSLIRATLKNKKIQAGAFFIGSYLNGTKGKALLKDWDNAGHLILNHTYNHTHYNDSSVSFQNYSNDFLQCDSLIKRAKNYKKIFRYPFLEDGNTVEKRAAMREFLKQHQYAIGYVSIVTTDWWINHYMSTALTSDPKTDLNKYKNLYLNNIKEAAEYYNKVSLKSEGRPVKHVLLLHHNLLNALFLNDLINMFEKNGWKIISAEDAYKDPIYKKTPSIFPSSGSLVLTLGKQNGSLKDMGTPVLPENQIYNKEYLKKFGL